MMNKMKRFLALVMAMMMFTSSMPVSALAESIAGSGSTGDHDIPRNWLTGGCQISVKAGETESYYVYLQTDSDSTQILYDGGQIAKVSIKYLNESIANTLWGTAYLCSVTVEGLGAGTGTLNVNTYDSANNAWSNTPINVKISAANAETEPTTPPAEVTTYTVTLAGNDGSGNTRTETIASGAYFELPDWFLDGYTHKGFAYDPEGTLMINGGFTVTGDITIYAIWEANQPAATTYTVTFNSNGDGVNGQMDPVTKNANEWFDLPACAFNRTNYTFKGWAYDAAGNSMLTNGFNVNNNVTLYAIWEAIPTEDDGEQGDNAKYVSLNGGKYQLTKGEKSYFTYTGDNHPETVFGWNRNQYNSYISIGVDKVENGEYSYSPKTYYFWLEGKEVTNGVAYEMNFVNKETFEVIENTVKYNVSFVAGEGTGEMAATTAGASYKLPACTFTAPAEMEFAGWSVNGEVKQPGDTVTISGDTTITATWKALPAKVTVVFDNLQGNTADSVETRATYTIDLPTGLSRDGFNFLGWSDVFVNDLGKKEAVSSYYNSTYTVPENISGEKTLFAVWQQ